MLEFMILKTLSFSISFELPMLCMDYYLLSKYISFFYFSLHSTRAPQIFVYPQFPVLLKKRTHQPLRTAFQFEERACEAFMLILHIVLSESFFLSKKKPSLLFLLLSGMIHISYILVQLPK